MTDTDRPRFARLLVALSETFNEPVSEVRADVYFNVLSRFPVEAVEQAAYRLLDTAEFFPKPAEFVTLLAGSVADQGELALDRITEEVKRTGYYRNPRLSEADYAMVCKVWGGWEGVCERLPARGTEEYQWERKRFLELHAAVTIQQQNSQAPLLTTGRAKTLLSDLQAHIKAMDTPKLPEKVRTDG